MALLLREALIMYVYSTQHQQRPIMRYLTIGKNKLMIVSNTDRQYFFSFNTVTTNVFIYIM